MGVLLRLALSLSFVYCLNFILRALFIHGVLLRPRLLGLSLCAAACSHISLCPAGFGVLELAALFEVYEVWLRYQLALAEGLITS